MRNVAATIALVVLALTLAAAGHTATRAGAVTLTGVVGPSFNISLKNRGKAVKVLAPTKYTFVIYDKSNIHNFHLIGPGVDRKTSVGGTGTTRWTLTLRAGTYRFICDPHATTMKGSFTVRIP